MDARTSRYHDVYTHWQRNPELFWADAAAEIDWYEKPKKIFDKDAGIYGRWFTDGVVNTCYNAVDRHVAGGRNNQAALIYDSPVSGEKRTITYSRLLSEVQSVGAMLRDFGVGKGDRVIIYMPMVPEAIFAMLACARIGAIHSVVFGGFAAKELATRIDDAKPKVILSASCGLGGARVIPYKPLLDEAIKLAQHKPAACAILQRPQCEAPLVAGRDHDWRRCWSTRSITPRPAIACRSPLPIRSISSTPPAPPACRPRGRGPDQYWTVKRRFGP
jgi:propionyl-CoA synthetase